VRRGPRKYSEGVRHVVRGTLGMVLMDVSAGTGVRKYTAILGDMGIQDSLGGVGKVGRWGRDLQGGERPWS
jgi:hypothetical protein